MSEAVVSTQQAEAESKEFWAKAHRFLDASGIPQLYRDASFENVDHIPTQTRNSYITKLEALKDRVSRSGIVALIGPRGVGKTWMACAMVKESCRLCRPAVYLEAMDYFIALQETYGDGSKATASAVEAKYLAPKLLVLDAMEERADTPWNDRMLTRLINKRYAAELATVLISNETPADFQRRVGDSIADRIRDGGGRIVCDWKSLRGNIRLPDSAESE